MQLLLEIILNFLPENLLDEYDVWTINTVIMKTMKMINTFIVV